MDCIYCNTPMSLIDSTVNSDLYVCDCGARGEDCYTMGMYFEHPAEEKNSWMSSAFYDEMFGVA